MSFSVNNGFKFNTSDFQELHSKLIEIRPKCLKRSSEEIRTRVESICNSKGLSFWDACSTFRKDQLDYSRHYYGHSHFSTYIRIYPYKNEIYGIIEAPKKVLELIIAENLVTPYSYYDCLPDELPEGVTEQEMEIRRKVWDFITSELSCSKFGYNLELVSWKDALYEVE